ncbi:MAG: phosphoribosylformylglycinamidine cyclo-ligase [Verrucomicrobiae bacterium]|nr:phosphoribosylformylglycinamidine cyclo-ligase [Verrucomicrobiae bacterium]
MSHKQKAYAAAGVDIDFSDSLKANLGKMVARTHRSGVLGKIGGFGGLFQLDLKKYREPVLVSSVDGVGTKLKVAAMMNRHDTIGQDLVNHCVNDIAVLGAEPLYFLDYIGTGKLRAEVFNGVIKGLSKACAVAGCALIGGETAQMPGMYREGDYDLVGCIVGVVEKKKAIDGSRVRVGDKLIGLPSSGLHTNGYSLAREILFTKLRLRLEERIASLGCTLGNELLKVHRNYWTIIKPFLTQHSALSTQNCLHGLAHITGGGFLDNIPRVLPKKCDAVIQRGTWPVLPIFQLLQYEGHVDEMEMYRVFNMGIGMTLIVDAKKVDHVLAWLKRKKESAYVIGEIRKGRQRVVID